VFRLVIKRYEYGKTTPQESNGELVQSDIVINEATVADMKDYLSQYEGQTMPFGNSEVNPNDYTTEDLVGSVVAHELTHATDKNSNTVQNPDSTSVEREKKPRENQSKHLEEIKKKKEDEK